MKTASTAPDARVDAPKTKCNERIQATWYTSAQKPDASSNSAIVRAFRGAAEAGVLDWDTGTAVYTTDSTQHR